MANTQVTFDGNPNNARCESSIAINPNDPTQVVAASKKFRQHPDVRLHARAGILQHRRGGQIVARLWPALRAGRRVTVMTDPTLAWDDAEATSISIGLAGKNPPGLGRDRHRRLQVERRRPDVERAELDPPAARATTSSGAPATRIRRAHSRAGCTRSGTTAATMRLRAHEGPRRRRGPVTAADSQVGGLPGDL